MALVIEKTYDDIIFLMEKFYLDLNNGDNSPEKVLTEISTNYNIPVNEIWEQVDIINSAYEGMKQIFLKKCNISEPYSDFSQLFYVESPMDVSPAMYLYLYARSGGTFNDDNDIEGEDFIKRKYIISQIISDDFNNLKDMDNACAITEYLWNYPATHYKKWVGMLTLYHAKRMTDILFDLLKTMQKEFIQFSSIYDSLKNIDLNSEKNDILLSKILGDTKDKEIIRIPSVACFNAVKYFEDEFSNRIYVFIGVLYNKIGDIISKYNDNDKIIVNRLKTIGESSRLEILKQLRKGPMCGKDIAEHLGLTQATVSHHMNSLLNEGLVFMYRTGTRIDYKVNKNEAKKLIGSLQHILFS